jgi:hypothetical protein
MFRALVWLLVLASPARAQFGPKQTLFRNSVQAWNGSLDVHGVASGTITGPTGATTQYNIDQHVSGTLKLDQYNPLIGGWTGTLDGTITITESSILTFACTVTNTLTASSSAATDFLGQPLKFNLTFDIGSDTWSLWPSNDSINGTNKSVQNCAGQESTSTAINPMRFMPINMTMRFPFPASGFDLVGASQVLCDSCGNSASATVAYTFTYNLKSTTNPCDYTLSTPSLTVLATSTTGSFTINTQAGCTWTALPNVPWIVVTSGASGSGNGTVNFSVQSNNGAPRSGGITAGGQTFLITQAGQGARFIPVTPCRIADTRNANGSFGGPTMAGGVSRTFNVPQSACNIPSTALAYSLNVTVVPHAPLGYLTLSPTGQARPFVSTLNSPSGKVLANAAIVPAGTNGGIDVFVTDSTDVILDINGYFAPPGATAGLAFYPVTPCRVADTRNATGTFGGPFLAGGASRSFPVPSSACGIPATAQAYSLNATVVPKGSLSYLTLWPTGQAQPFVSTLNSFDGSIVANAAIVPAGTGGAISAFVTDATELVLDINGYFAPPSAGGIYFYPVTPCRVADTRNAAGTFGGPTMPGGSSRSFPVPASGCGIPSAALAYSMNATVVPAGPLSYLTLWPSGASQPFVSTLNSFAGLIVANAALVPSGASGGVSAFVTNTTDLVLDINGYFAP